jgi:uncharacterized protein YfdQ (DUF2303 family)
MLDKNVQSENEAVIELMRDIDGTEEIDLGDDNMAISLPKGRTIQSIKGFIDEYRTAPVRTEGTATLTTLASFVAHLNRFKQDKSAVFANDGARPSLISIIDYHAKSDPAFCKHRGQYAFPLSVEWQAWQGIAGTAMSQQQFATFLEDRITDVLPPELHSLGVKELARENDISVAARLPLLTLARGLSINVESKIANHTNLSTGEGVIAYEEAHKDGATGAPLKVPTGFVIAVPLFQGGDAYPMLVRLRYRVAGGKVTWTLSLFNAQKVITVAVADAVAIVTKETGVPVFMGASE